MTSSYQLKARVVKLLDTYEFDSSPIWRLSEGKHGVVKLELTWQPPNQAKQQKRLQKKTPGRKKEAESGYSTGIRSSAKTASPAGEWPRQPSPARTPSPKSAPPTVQSPPKPPPVEPPSVEMVSPLGIPDTTPPPGIRWTPKTPPQSSPSQPSYKEDYEPVEDKFSSLKKYRVSKIFHGGTPEIALIVYQLQCLGGSVGCAVSSIGYCRPTGDQVAGSTPAEVGNILSWRLIMKYFLRSFSPFR